MFSIIQAAGWPIWFLILSSIVALALIIERSMSLRIDKIAPPKLLDEVLILTRHGIHHKQGLSGLQEQIGRAHV